MTDTTSGAVAARPDLLALTADTLAALANRGLVKRATKELDAGTVPALTTDPDTTVRARFGDGTTTALPPGKGLDDGECSCVAPGVCRHLIALVLAYQRRAEARTDGGAPVPVADWSPGSTDDAALAEAVGARPLAVARRTFERGYAAVVHRPSPDHPEPRVELPTCTVRFPVPGEIAYALTDAAASLRGEVVALAVWAFRAADAAGTDERSVPVQVGGRATAPSAAGPVLDAAVGLAGELLAEGVAHVGPVHGGALARAGAGLTAESLHWPAGALAELTDQLTAYADRNAHYRPELVAALVTELYARRRAATLPGVLGTLEAGDTPLRRVRLTSLGCRVHGTPQSLICEVYFAHPGAGTVLVLRKTWTAAEGKELTGHLLSTRRVLATPLSSLAAGNLVSESVRRTPSRALTVARGRLGTTTITPVGAAWTELPEPLLVRDLSALTAGWEGRAPRLIRPRIEAEAVHVVALSEVESVGYDPGEQRLEAVVRDASGTPALVTSGHRPECPGALYALADALERGATHVSGSVHRSGGGIRIDPIAVLTPAGVVVPDLAPGDGSTALTAAVHRPSDPLTAVLDEAISAMSAVPHSGLRHLNSPARSRIDEAATALSHTGLTRAATLLRAFLDALDNGAAPNEEGLAARCDAWLEAQLHLLVSSEVRSSQTEFVAASAPAPGRVPKVDQVVAGSADHGAARTLRALIAAPGELV
ncbi:hypothetical protein P6B95_37620 [Streptomyces atratus]|uniref:hypothetical protein n=1 Tax=Streptomyces atratus TaxID=1893 RepID=UPI002AC364A0|nr:hypothetical protein [Streptomyces atratus]WPW32531.1 hypothetical protein P6B95_37620 [Streptomyces atratus]